MVCAAPALEHILQVFHAFRARLTLNAFEFSPKPPSKRCWRAAMCAAPLTR